jgi:ribosome biogenesis protein UTP30
MEGDFIFDWMLEKALMERVWMSSGRRLCWTSHFWVLKSHFDRSFSILVGSSTMAQGSDSKKGVELDSTLVTKAVHALLKHHESKTSNELLGNESNIHVLISLIVPPTVASGKHHEIVLPHALYKDLDDAEVCLIVKNEATKKDIQELKAQFVDLLKPVKKILTLDSLRSKHGDYAQRRSLLKRFSQFLVDDRITPLMPRALGRDFIRKHKLPLSIKIASGSGGTNTNLATALQRGVRSTYYTVNAGSCVSVKVAVTTMTVSAVVDNIMTASKSLHFPTKAIQNVCIKSPESAALPIYHQTPEQLYDFIAQARDEAAAAEQTTAVEENVPAVDAASASKSAKSPLLKAIQKQKKLEKNDAKQPSKESKTTTEKEKTKDAEINKDKDGKFEAKKVTDDKDETAVKKDDKEAKKSKKKRRSKSTEKPEAKKIKNDKSNDQVMTIKEKGASIEKPKESKQKQGDTATSSSGKKDKTPGKSEADTKLAKGKKDSGNKRTKQGDDTPSPTKKNKIDDSATDNADFLPATKYTESKKDYVYKKGPKGLGYYVDTKPVVNKQAMDALRRSSQSPRGTSKNSKKPRFESKNSSKRRR